MRREEFGVGSYIHVFNRGTKRMDIVRDDGDRWRFLKLVRYLNDENVPRNWERDISPGDIRAGFARPKHWPIPKPYVSILAYCLMDNHYHFLLRENIEGGTSKFMHRLGTSMSKYFNEKYGEKGTLFEGPYKTRTVANDRHLQYLQAYIHVKNPLEKYPGGTSRALRDFDAAYEWAAQYEFAGLRQKEAIRSALLDITACTDILLDGTAFRNFAHDVISGRELLTDWEREILDSF